MTHCHTPPKQMKKPGVKELLVFSIIALFFLTTNTYAGDTCNIFNNSVAGSNVEVGNLFIDATNTTRNNIRISSEGFYFPISFDANNFNLNNQTKNVKIFVNLANFNLQPDVYSGNFIITSSTGTSTLPATINLPKNNSFSVSNNISLTLNNSGGSFLLNITNNGNYNMNFAISSSNSLFYVSSNAIVLRNTTQQVKVQYFSIKGQVAGNYTANITFTEANDNIKTSQINYIVLDAELPVITDISYRNSLTFGDKQVIKVYAVDNVAVENIKGKITCDGVVVLDNFVLVYDSANKYYIYEFFTNSTGFCNLFVNATDNSNNSITANKDFLVSKIPVRVEASDIDFGGVQINMEHSRSLLVAYTPLVFTPTLISSDCSDCVFAINGKIMNVGEALTPINVIADASNPKQIPFYFLSNTSRNVNFLVGLSFNEKYAIADRTIQITANVKNTRYMEDYSYKIGNVVDGWRTLSAEGNVSTNKTGIDASTYTTVCAVYTGIRDDSIINDMSYKECKKMVSDADNEVQRIQQKYDNSQMLNWFFGILLLLVMIYLIANRLGYIDMIKYKIMIGGAKNDK